MSTNSPRKVYKQSDYQKLGVPAPKPVSYFRDRCEEITPAERHAIALRLATGFRSWAKGECEETLPNLMDYVDGMLDEHPRYASLTRAECRGIKAKAAAFFADLLEAEPVMQRLINEHRQ